MKGVESSKRCIHEQTKDVCELTAVIVELETATYERCLCNRKRMLRFCLKYLDSEGSVVMWSGVWEECADKITAERKGVL